MQILFHHDSYASEATAITGDEDAGPWLVANGKIINDWPGHFGVFDREDGFYILEGEPDEDCKTIKDLNIRELTPTEWGALMRGQSFWE